MAAVMAYRPKLLLADDEPAPPIHGNQVELVPSGGALRRAAARSTRC
ncbi:MULTISPECIES: hypothetical protein [unclassified Nocardiopsis]|nr:MULTISPECIES: hypothetical protein [unclassified Nocardiopsis]